MRVRYLQNLPRSRAFKLTEAIAPGQGHPPMLALAEAPGVDITLLALAAGESMAARSAEGDGLVQVLQGCGQFTVGGLRHRVCAGEALVLSFGVPHEVRAVEDFTMLLTVVKPHVDKNTMDPN